MEKNYSSTDHSPVFDPDLSLPHFDEDATLLSARPVVPLHEVKSETRSRRRVIFGLTILAAILLGAISATLMLMQSAQNPESAAEIEVSQPAVTSSGAAGGSTSERVEARAPVAREPVEEPSAREVPSDRDFSVKKRSTAPILRGSVKPAGASRSSREREEDFEDDARELRRMERKNTRREARRERRDRREQRVDDLLRIREIFEGSPRP
jgi:hypothetical protein